MSSPQAGTVLWPDLSRFGARLSVAFNPSSGRNFLKFSVLDGELLSQAGHYPAGTNLFVWMREKGFVSDRAEVTREVVRAREALRAAGDLTDEAWERLSRSDRLYFYAPLSGLTQSLVTGLIPAVDSADFRQMSIAEVKHPDSRILPKEVEVPFIERMTDFAGDERGVLYTIPRDREWWDTLAQQEVDLVSILLRKEDAEALSMAPAREFSHRFVPSDVLVQLLKERLLLPDGQPLRSVTARAAVLGYASRSAAIDANGGREDGIERVELKTALPLGVDTATRQVVAVKEGRFLELATHRFRALDLEDLSEVRTIAQRFAVGDRVVEARRRWDAAVAAEAFDRGAWTYEKLEAVLPLLESIETSIQDIAVVAGGEERQEGCSRSFVARQLGTTSSALAPIYGEAFSEYLDQSAVTLQAAKDALAGHRAEQAAARGLEQALASVGRKAEDPSGRREDAGEKIGGARKDYAKHGLQVGEVETLTPSEWKEVVTKDNVWPPLDYAAMRENGVAPDVAWSIRELRKALPVNPYRGGYNARRRDLDRRGSVDLTQWQCESFVRAVSLVREKIADARNWTDLMEGIQSIREEAGLCVYVATSDSTYSSSGGCRWDSDEWFSDGAGYVFCAKTLPDVYFDASGRRDNEWSFDTLRSLARTKTGDEWGWAIKEKAPREKPAVEKEKKPEPEYVHLAHIDRVGQDYRKGGDVDEQMLLDVFGFRGLEYGNWLPQAERQQVLNHAFDAFIDLAAAMKLPPRAMSLGGKLALAFGARGTGGRQAARAHFEPGRFVMNLTRLSGAGCVAHEWGHAFDLALSQKLGASSMRFLSEFSTEKREAADKLPRDFFSVLKAASERPLSREGFIAKVTRVELSNPDNNKNFATIGEYGRSCLRSWLANINHRLPEPLSGGEFTAFGEALLDLHFQEVSSPELAAAGVKRFVDPDLFMESIRSFVPAELQGDLAPYLSGSYPKDIGGWSSSAAARVEKRLKEFAPGRYIEETDMLADAKFYDGFRSKPYWSTPVEIFARSLEAWVQDRIESDGVSKSQYLVHGRLPPDDVERSAWPRGVDRGVIFGALDRLFDENRPRLVQFFDAEAAVAVAPEVALA